MAADTATALLAGAFGLVGVLGGAFGTNLVNTRAEQRRLAADDARRWLATRREIYGSYLALTESMLREIEGVATALSYDGSKPASEDDHLELSDGLLTYMLRWDDALQPALYEVQLMASAHVADLADRMAGALMELGSLVDRDQTYTDYSPHWFRARDMNGALRNAMREELGLAPVDLESPRDDYWPWLPTPHELSKARHPSRRRRSSAD